MKKKNLLWLCGYFILVLIPLCTVAILTIEVDPFFHYHKPKTDKYYYPINNQRSQNDGIIRHFEYDGIVIGTSMTENFKTSEAEAKWGGSFIKVPFSGGSYKEINDNLKKALKYHPEIKVIIRGLDMNMFADEKDRMRSDLGSYPLYLYNEDALDDIHYVLNRDVLFSRVYSMIQESQTPGFQSGIISFDECYNWMKRFHFGKNVLYPKGIKEIKNLPEEAEIDEETIQRVMDNIRQNVTSIAENNPNVDFYCFIPPYSAKWWQGQIKKGNVKKQIQIEKIVIEEILKSKNIHLFSFNNLFGITTDLNNYKDSTHYGEWINSFILSQMSKGQNQLTEENYEAYLREEYEFYSAFDYAKMNEQEDYEDDYLAESAFVQENESLK